MAINRYELTARHNPVLKRIEYNSPLTIGNGEFAFTADVTGLQTLYEEYKEHSAPLCTMSQWGWHTTPVNKERYAYTPEDILMTEYDYAGRKVTYAVEVKSGNEETYYWLRQNPHRLNLGRLGLLYRENRIRPEDITDIRQTLYLYEGILDSTFLLQGKACRVRTCCHQKYDSIAVQLESSLLNEGLLSVLLAFPYGSSDITASDFEQPDRHTTLTIQTGNKELLMKRTLDRTEYYVHLRSDQNINYKSVDQHHLHITANPIEQLNFSVTFSEKPLPETPSVEQVFQSSREEWRRFWENGAVVDLHRSKDSRANELERRMVLSMYQSAIQSCGSLPPQETGLTCNSWHGKFHLEMYLWHLAYLPLWNRPELLNRSLPWFLTHLPEAKANAARNGFQGAKWPKQVAYDGIDSPSPIATLLIWQQPHIIYLLELVYQSLKGDEICNIEKYSTENIVRKNIDEPKSGEQDVGKLHREKLLETYWSLVKETADYMADLAVFNPRTCKYDLVPPIIPAQEAHDPRITLNPIFEVEYWRFTLRIAYEWAMRLGLEGENITWFKVSENMAELPNRDGLYLAHENCPATYEKFNKDHPMMLAVYGLLPGKRVDRETMKRTLDKTIECWNYDTMWGWDFAMMAMTAVRLGQPDLAVELLLKDTPNNQYVTSGNNSQKKREDLPLYLPGNGSLLLAIAMMTAGYHGCDEDTPGFPKNGMWSIEYENMLPFPY